MHDYEQRKDGDRYPQDDAEYERFPANRLDFFDRQSGTYQEERYDESRFRYGRYRRCDGTDTGQVAVGQHGEDEEEDEPRYRDFLSLQDKYTT